MRSSNALAAVLVVSFGFALAGPARADEIGRAQFNGREIILHDDNRWEYAPEDAQQKASSAAAAEDCQRIASKVLPVSICLDGGSWAFATLEGSHEQGFRVKDTEHYMMLITEEDYFPLKTLRDAIVTNAQNAAGLQKVDILVDGTAELNGSSFGHIVYRTTIDGLDITYDNYYSGLEGKGSLQYIFFAETPEYDSYVPMIEQAAAGITVAE